jgi:hypothetical protein
VARAALARLALLLLGGVLFAGAVPGAGDARAQGLVFLEREPGPYRLDWPHDGGWFSYRCGRVQGPAMAATASRRARRR